MLGCQCTPVAGVSHLRQANQASVDWKAQGAGSHGATCRNCDKATFPPSGRLPFEKLDRARNDDYDIRKEGPQTRAAAAVPGRGRVSLFSHHYAGNTSARSNPVWLI
jgi:hypothetical protein